MLRLSLLLAQERHVNYNKSIKKVYNRVALMLTTAHHSSAL